jgi:hypothetical protein
VLAAYEGGNYRLEVTFAFEQITLAIRGLSGETLQDPLLLVKRQFAMHGWFPWSFNADGSKVVGMVYQQYAEKETDRFRAYVYEVDIEKEVDSEGKLNFSIEKEETVYQTTEVINTSRTLKVVETLKTAVPNSSDMIVIPGPAPTPTRGVTASGNTGEYSRTVEIGDETYTGKVFYDEYPAGYSLTELPVTEEMNENIKKYGYSTHASTWNSLFLPAYDFVENASTETLLSGVWPISVYFSPDGEIVIDTIDFSSRRVVTSSSRKTQDFSALEGAGTFRAYVGGDGTGGGVGPRSPVTLIVNRGNQEFSQLDVSFSVESQITLNGRSLPFSNYNYNRVIVSTCRYSSTGQSIQQDSFGCDTYEEVTVSSANQYQDYFSGTWYYKYVGVNVPIPGWTHGPAVSEIRFDKTYSYTENQQTSGEIHSLLVSNGPFNHRISSVTQFSGSYSYNREWGLKFNQSSTTTLNEKYNRCTHQPWIWTVNNWDAIYYDTEMELTITNTVSTSVSGEQISSLSTGHEISADGGSKSSAGTSTLTLTTDDMPRRVIYGVDFGIAPLNITIPVLKQTHNFAEDTAVSKLVSDKVKEMRDKKIPVPPLNAYIRVNEARIFDLADSDHTTKDSKLLSRNNEILHNPVVTNIPGSYNYITRVRTPGVPYVIDYSWITKRGKLYYIFNLHGVPVEMASLFSHVGDIYGLFQLLDSKKYKEEDRINLILSPFGDFSNKLSLSDSSVYYVTVALE